MIEKISSSKNPKFKLWQELLFGRGIQHHNLCLAAGNKIIQELAESKPDLVQAILFPDGMEINGLSFLNSLKKLNATQVFQLDKALFNELNELGTNGPLAVMQTPTVETYIPKPPQGLEIVVPFSDPGNIGAVIRSAVAFGVSKIILTTESANPFLARAIRGSAGLSFFAPLKKASSLQDIDIDLALDMSGTPMQKYKWSKNVRLLIGEEGRGIPKHLDRIQKIGIAMHDQVDSLNATVAASVAIYSYYFQHGATF